MANFNTHLSVALGVGSLAAVVAVNGGLADVAQSPWYIAVGAMGGMLPDIDSDHSRLAKRLFMGLASCCAGMAWFALERSLNQQALLMTVLAVLWGIRYLALYLFQKVTVHRGVFHSVLAGIFFALLLVCIQHYMLEASKAEAWLSGVFLLLGFLVHLCLDELYSVDLANGRIKKSFGTALKVYGYQNIPGSVLLLCLVAGLLTVAPSPASFYKAFRLVDWASAADIGSQFSRVLQGRL